MNLVHYIEQSKDLSDCLSAEKLFYQPSEYYNERCPRFHIAYKEVDYWLKNVIFQNIKIEPRLALYFANWLIYYENFLGLGCQNNEEYLSKSIWLLKYVKDETDDMDLKLAAESNLGSLYAIRQQNTKNESEQKEMFLLIQDLDKLKTAIQKAVQCIRLSVAWSNITEPDYEKVEEYCLWSLKHAGEIENKAVRADLRSKALHNLGNMFLWSQKRDLQKARDYLNQAIEVKLDRSLFPCYSVSPLYVNNLAHAYIYDEEIQEKNIKIRDLFQKHYELAKQDLTEEHPLTKQFRYNFKLYDNLRE